MKSQLVVACVLLIAGFVSSVPVKSVKPKMQENTTDDYYPCRRQVGVFFDESLDIPKDTFKLLKDFVINQVFLDVNHPERLAFGGFDDDVTYNWSFGFDNTSELFNHVNAQYQDNKTQNIGAFFKLLANTNVLELKDLPKTLIVLTGKFDAEDAKASDSYVKQLKEQGYFVSIIAIKLSVDMKALDKVGADYWYAFDLVNGSPKNIRNSIEKAHGCASH